MHEWCGCCSEHYGDERRVSSFVRDENQHDRDEVRSEGECSSHLKGNEALVCVEVRGSIDSPMSTDEAKDVERAHAIDERIGPDEYPQDGEQAEPPGQDTSMPSRCVHAP